MSIVTGTDELAAICERFAAFPYVTVDTEFMRETTYWPKLCVIQLASPDEAFVIDALAPDIDLAPFEEVLAPLYAEYAAKDPIVAAGRRKLSSMIFA